MGEPRPPADEHAAERATADELAKLRALARKATLASLTVSTLAVFIFWLGWVRAPTPTQICQHKIELVTNTLGQDQSPGAAALVSQLEANCVDGAEQIIRLRGKVVYAKYAKCVSAATSLAEAEQC